jgi:hypothetical protein
VGTHVGCNPGFGKLNKFLTQEYDRK